MTEMRTLVHRLQALAGMETTDGILGPQTIRALSVYGCVDNSLIVLVSRRKGQPGRRESDK